MSQTIEDRQTGAEMSQLKDVNLHKRPQPEDADFRTFSHINDYLDEGYGSLHRMVVTSRPLVLWAPSGSVLEHYRRLGKSRIGIYGMVRLVEEGHVRVIGRRNWLLERTSRGSHPWEGAKWLPRYDAEIRRIALEDDRSSIPEANRRVVLLGEESGREWARGVLSEGGEMTPLVRRIDALLRARQVPLGSLQKAEKLIAAGRPRIDALSEILRDARNHRDAIASANAQIPFLSDHDADFFRLLPTPDANPLDSRLSQIDAVPAEQLARNSEFARWTTSLIKDIENAGAGRRLQASTIRAFLKSDAHLELISWLGEATRLLATTPLLVLDEYLRNELASRVRLGVQPRRALEFLGAPLEPLPAVMWLIGTGIGLVSWRLAPTDLLSIGGFIFGTAPTPAYVAYQQILMKAPKYHGPQWPFALAAGKSRPSEWDISVLTATLRRAESS